MKARTITPKTKRVRIRKNGKHKVDAASTMTVELGPTMRRFVRPQARFNWLMPNVGSITPQYIETVLNGALAGNHVQAWWLFDLMLRTWPELLQCYDELIYGVLRKKIVFEPAQSEEDKPTPTADERLKVCEAALKSMDDDPAHDGNDLVGTLRDILDAWFRGVSVSEIVWRPIETDAGQIMAPQCTYALQPNNYAWSADWSLGLVPVRQQQQNGSGIFYPFASTSAQPNPADVIPFPPNKFLTSVHKAKAGSPLAGSLLTPLAWWWCAANFSSDWLLNLAQVFGLPFRWANYDPNAPQATIDAICNMLQNMGSAAWAAFPAGTTLERISPSASQGSDHSPQGELLDRADRYARNLILGQTMTGSHGTTGKGGGQAFGEVEADVKSDRIDAAGRFAENVINKQLIPAILNLNFGDASEAPTVRFLEDEEAGLTEAQRDKTLIDAGLEIGVDFMRKKYGVPKPAEGEETLTKPEPPAFGDMPGKPNDKQTVKEKLQALNAIQDDAVFSRELSELAAKIIQ